MDDPVVGVPEVVVWYRRERTLSIHCIDTTSRETFYWLTVLFTLALGTAAGDLVSERMDLGYWLAEVLFALAIGAVAVAHFTLVAALVTGTAAILGAIGAVRPLVGRLVERTADLMMLLPAVLGILLVTLSWPDGGRLAVIAAVVLGVPYAVRLAASAAAPVAETGYVEAAAAGGERLWYLVVREILPNLRATLLALFGLRFVAAVYLVATAGFLQVGPQPPAADWALMIRENSPGILLNPWSVVAPSIAIGLLALSVNLAAAALAPQTGRKAVTVL